MPNETLTSGAAPAARAPSSTPTLEGAERAPPVALGEPLLSSTRLRLRLMLLALLLVCSLTGLSLSLVSSVFSELTPSLEEDLRWKAQQGVSELSQTADLGVLAGNREVLEKATERSARERDFVYVAFHDAAGKVLFERGSAAGLPAIEHTPESISQNERVFAAWAPINVEGLVVGSVTLAVSKQRLNSGAQLYRSFVTVGLLGALGALVLALLFVRRYIAPILQLTERTLVELAHTAEAALASARAKSQFLANMSHEIRTPMNGVFGMLRLVQQTELSVQQRRYMDVMSASAQSLLTVVNDVLDFSKLEANRYELAPIACQPRELIEQVVQLYQARADEKQLALHAHVDPSVPDVITVDRDRLRQVLGNLLSNAVKFTSHGAVEVRVGTLADPLGGAPGRWLEVLVRDTGVGITESSRGQLFSAFTQVDASASRAHEGTGLGLAISRKLLELMGGSIEHVQPDGPGSIFRVLLPIAGAAAAELPSAGATVPSAPAAADWRFRSTLPILLVDDNEINLLVAVELLEGMGLNVEVASGGREAVESALAAEYALVLMDCQMPEVDGYQAASLIRQQRNREQLPIVAFTAHALAEERAKVTACGMDDIVTKPVDPDQLGRVLARWLTVVSGPVPASHTSSKAPMPLNAPDGSAAVLDSGRRRPLGAARLFLAGAPAQMEALARLAADGRRDELKALAHKLKGSAGSLGALQLASLCDRLQIVAPSASAAQLELLVEQISRACAAASQLLSAEVERRTEAS